MPVTKFKHASDMPRLTRVDDAELIHRIRTLWNRAFALSPPRFPRGVLRFRNMAEANQARAAAVAERMRRRAATSEQGAVGPEVPKDGS